MALVAASPSPPSPPRSSASCSHRSAASASLRRTPAMTSAPLIATGTSDSSPSAASSSSDPAPTTSFPAAKAAKRWRPFGRIGDVFGTWTQQKHGEPCADIDIEMATRRRLLFLPGLSMLKANSAPPGWANGRVGDGWAPRFQSNLRLNIDSGAGSRQPAASSSVASASGKSAAEAVVGAGTPSGSVMGAGSAFGSVVSASTASGQRAKTDWMKNFKGLLVAYVFFALPTIILFFFPRYDKNKSHPVLQNLMDNSKVDSEKGGTS